MKFNSIVILMFLIIPFFITSRTSAEIFELVNYYDITAGDIESADFNNDGLEDFTVTDWIIDSSYYEVFLSNGDCSFNRLGPAYVDTSYIGQLLTGDFNEDSKEDMLLMNLEDTWLYLGDGTGSFTLDEIFSWSLCNGCVGDINKDGHLDIIGIPINSWVLCDAYGDSIIVMLGDGAGGFAEEWVYDEYPPGSSQGYSSSHITYFDNPDTNLDLCVTCLGAWGGLLTFQGVGDGGFNDPVYYEMEMFGLDGPLFSTCGDFDEDDFIDIAVAGDAGMSNPSTIIFINQQDRTFEQFGPDYFYGASSIEIIATADLDLDGHLDLSVEGSIAGYGNGIFDEYLSSVPGADFIDMDLDGDLDLVMRWGGIYRNTTINLGIEEHESGPIYGLILEVSPNPFSSSVTVSASGFLSNPTHLQIFDLSGRLVTEIEPTFNGSEAVYQWNGRSETGAELPDGIYSARLSSTAVMLLKLE